MTALMQGDLATKRDQNVPKGEKVGRKVVNGMWAEITRGGWDTGRWSAYDHRLNVFSVGGRQ
jgi:hypothetical protein